MFASGTKASPSSSLLGVASAGAAWIFSRYVGSALWIPAAVTLLLAFVFTKLGGPKAYRGAIAITLGHLAWFVAAAIISGQWAPVAIDIALLLVSVSWLWARPSNASVGCLAVVQALSLLLNIATIVGVNIGTDQHRALTVHCTWRILALGALLVGVSARRRATQIAAPDDASDQRGN